MQFMFLQTITFWMLLYYFGLTVCEQHIIRLNIGETLEFTNDKYPETSKNVIELWMFGTTQGGAIKLDCDDIRINSKVCVEDSLMVSAGDIPQTICDTRQNYSVISLFNALYVQLNLKQSGGAFRCKVEALASAEHRKIIQNMIHLNTGEINEEIFHNGFSRMKLYEYIFSTDPGSMLIAKCGLTHVSPDENQVILTLKSGNEISKYYNSDINISFYSEDEILKIDLETGLQVGNGYLFCSVRSIEADRKYSKYKQIDSEEVDSSEHGLISRPGPKSTTCNCGWANKDNRRIIYGHDTGPHEYPWSVSLQTASGFHFCGGSIISEYHILTAAHCIHTKAEEIYVLMGTNNNKDYKLVTQVKQIILHNFDKATAQNDIAILVLAARITFTQFIGPVCLPVKDPRIDHQYVTAMGWGQLGEGEYQVKDRNLQKETKLRAIDIFSCTLDWNFPWNLKDAKVMCTWSNRTDICLGDSGGPVVWLDPATNRYTLVGMPALCDGCKLTRPSVHTSVYHFYNWIQNKIASSEPNGKTCSKID